MKPRIYEWFNTLTDATVLEVSDEEASPCDTWLVLKLLSTDPVNEDLWERIKSDPNEVFIGLRDAGIIPGDVVLRRFVRTSTKQHDRIEVWYFEYPPLAQSQSQSQSQS